MAINYSGLGMFAPFTQTMTNLGQNIGRATGLMFGIEDPELEAMNAIEIASKNPNDPVALQNAATKLAQAGKLNEAIALSNQARQIQNRREDIGFRERQMQISEKTADRAEKVALMTRIKETPYAAIDEVNILPEGPEKEGYLKQISAQIGKENFAQAIKESQLKVYELQAEAAKLNAQVGKKVWDLKFDPLKGTPILYNTVTREISRVTMPGTEGGGGASEDKSKDVTGAKNALTGQKETTPTETTTTTTSQDAINNARTWSVNFATPESVLRIKAQNGDAAAIEELRRRQQISSSVPGAM